MSYTCQFNACKKLVVPGTLKCTAHRRKGQCAFDGCHNQVYKMGVCVRHGARSTPCSIEGCYQNVRVSGLCNHHATILPATNCAHPGCMAKARGSATCKRHQRMNVSSPSRRRRHTAAARDRSRTIATAKYNNEDELTPIAVLDDKPLPATFLEEFQDMLAEMLWQTMTFDVPSDNVAVDEGSML
ncbi:hypothetical protein AeRB84_010336 [Aphanomyces euteiches]|nr:hypothetical protein AeRB84_010336 [Aphanomyces euteiches]